jgi:peptide/nickel transport system substrate-binding protein
VRAKALLQNAGVGDLSFTLTHKIEGFWPEMAQLIQSDLQAVGFTVTLRGLDEAAFYKAINASEHQAGLTDWVMDTGDPDNIMFSLFTTKRAQRMGYKNPEVDKLNLAAQVERNPSKRREMYIRAQRIILDDAPFVTIGYTQRAFGMKAGIEGILIGPLGDVVIRGVKMS